MKKILLLCGLAIINVTMFAQGKTLYVSTDGIYQNIYQIRDVDSIINIETAKMAEAYDVRKQALNDSIAKFFVDSVSMSDIAKETKRLALQKDISEMGQYEAQLKENLESYKEKVLTPIKKLVFETINAVGKAKGATTILFREQAIMIPPGTDITMDVIKRLNSIKPKK